jgi:hypothetical protein
MSKWVLTVYMRHNKAEEDIGAIPAKDICQNPGCSEVDQQTEREMSTLDVQRYQY